MLHDVSRASSHNLLCLRVLTNNLHNLRILHGHHVDLQVGLVVLIIESLDRLAVHYVHVLRHRIDRLGFGGFGHDPAGILDTQSVNHLTVQVGQIINLRGGLAKLEYRLILHDLLRHGGRIGV